jgi:hypothetical protein
VIPELEYPPMLCHVSSSDSIKLIAAVPVGAPAWAYRLLATWLKLMAAESGPKVNLAKGLHFISRFQ